MDSIPRIFHYCWFGRKPKPPEAVSFIKEWPRRNPGYLLKEWSEQNFDVTCCGYVRQAYEAGKYAFVSDYARGLALFNHGGIYLDTDVELVGSFDSFLQHEAFFGFEEGNRVATSTIGCRPGHPLMRVYLDQYHQRSFFKADGNMDMTTNVEILTNLLVTRGLKANGRHQVIPEGIVCYPMSYFSPLDYINHRSFRDGTTVAIHHYSHSWGGAFSSLKRTISRGISRTVGAETLNRLRKLLSLGR
jgi:hypothetical protein